MDKSQYVIASDVTAGKTVDSGRTSGQVTVTGTIDISSLPQGEYVITIDSPLDNTYEGYFDIIFLNTNDKN